VGMIIGIAAGVGGFLILVVAILVFLVVRSNRRRRRRKGFVPPPWKPIVFGKWLTLMYEANSLSKLNQLEELLVVEDMQLATAIAAVTQSTEEDDLSKAFAFLFASKGLGMELVKNFITTEIEKCSAPNSLFRGNSLATKLFQSYSRLVGLPFLWQVLGPFLMELDDDQGSEPSEEGRHSMSNHSISSLSLELDPNKMTDKGDADFIENKYTLMLITQRLFKLIINNADLLPNEMKVLLAHTAEQVEKKFPEAKYRAIGGLLFLRFIVPSISAPHVNGIYQNPPGQKTQRNLVLLSKVMQNLANGIKFGNKEAHMAKLNDFIEENIPLLHAYYDQIVEHSPVSPQVAVVDVPQPVKQNALLFSHNQTVTYLEAIVGNISDDLGENLKRVTSEIGGTIPKKKV